MSLGICLFFYRCVGRLAGFCRLDRVERNVTYFKRKRPPISRQAFDRMSEVKLFNYNQRGVSSNSITLLNKNLLNRTGVIG